MLSKLLKQDRMLAPRIILALTTAMMLTCSATVSFGQSAEPRAVVAPSTAGETAR